MANPSNALLDTFVGFGRAAQNALEVARFGGLDTGATGAPYEVVAEHRMYRLRRYLPEGTDGQPSKKKAKQKPPVILVPPMMLSADVYDIADEASAVRVLAASGVEPWVIDFGAPDEEEGGLERNLTDHVLAVSQAVGEVNEATGRDVHLSGYSQGGMFCYVAAAHRRCDGIASLVTYGSAVDMTSSMPPGLSEENYVDLLEFVANQVSRIAIPAWLSRTGFRMLDPVKTIRDQAGFLFQLHDRDSLLPREEQRRFLMNEGWVAWSGPAVAELVRQYVVANRMLAGGWVVEGDLVTLADIDCPMLCFVGTKDDIAPAPTVRAVLRAAPRADIYETPIEKGHFGLVVGSQAKEVTWPTVGSWVDWVDNGKPLPDHVQPLVDEQKPPSAMSRLEQALGLSTNLAIGMGRAAVESGRAGARAAAAFASGAVDQLPRLSRLDRVRPNTRVSLGEVMAEQAAEAPDDTVFLFEDRAHTYGAANERVDNVVRGLISLGVRRGEHVGVLMDTRPSALGVVIALNRVGAVAVMLRPDGDLAREVKLAACTRVVADPEHGDAAVAATDLKVHVLGGGAGPRDLGSAVDDMERIDPDAVELPAWYEPNPGVASDLAFILFSGSGERTRLDRVTNGRWALSAFGTATSAAFTRADTVLSMTPIHHSSALLVGIGGAIAGRARLAMARRFDPEEFWTVVRRNGVTAVTYTWTMLADLLEQPHRVEENHHPIRSFIGSGMPREMWRRVESRWAPARVIEFYASTRSGAVLVNLGTKTGSLGRPLPGSADVRVARYDLDTERLVEGADGFVERCDDDETGMLLARLPRRDAATSDKSLRSLFEKGDAWLETGDLAKRDADSDFWLLGSTESLIRTTRGATAPIPVQNAVDRADAVHLSCVYPVTVGRGRTEVAAAVVLRKGQELTAAELAEAVSVLDLAHRPRYVRIVDEIPRTTWYRVRTDTLRAEGVGKDAGPMFVLGKNQRTYRKQA